MKVQPRDSRSEGPGTLQWGAEYALLSSSGVTGKVAASISDRRGNGLGVGEGASRTNFHPDSECQLRGPASPASPHCRPPPLLMPRQNCLLCPRAHSPLLLSGFRGLADQENGSPVGPRALASRTLRGGFHSSQGGFSSLKVLTACPCPPLQVPSCLLSCPHSHLQSLTCCHHASEAQEQVPCLREKPPGPGGHSGGPGQCC